MTMLPPNGPLNNPVTPGVIERGASDDEFPNINWLWTGVLVAVVIVALVIASRAGWVL